MRKIIHNVTISLDGYFEGPDHDLDWGQADDEVHSYLNGLLAGMSAFLEGRKTYELMAAYWPTADQDPNSTPPTVEFARIWRDVPKYVYSTTLAEVAWNSTLLRSVDADAVTALKNQPGGLMVIGSVDLAASFHALDQIDEYWLWVNPVVLGAGRSFFAPGGPPLDLTLIETRAFGNGVVLLRYRR